MRRNLHNILRDFLGITLFLVFIYLTIVINLAKSTGRPRWNILKSPGLPEFMIFAVAVIFVIILVKLIRKSKKRK